MELQRYNDEQKLLVRGIAGRILELLHYSPGEMAVTLASKVESGHADYSVPHRPFSDQSTCTLLALL